jgi:redox-sensitive bicupin YhaK (pirin superfamily)
MDRKDFIKKGALAAGTVAAVSGLSALSAKTEQTEGALVGFNHLPVQKDNIMENAILHKASTRGHANHGWLDSHHSFSFASYYNPKRMHFGVLRVLNDDVIDGGSGFGMHPHDNMEIISIPLEGALEHKDSMGNVAVIQSGDVQVMSAGTGIFHSEYNKHPDQAGKFLQIWIYPNQRNVTPRYDQITLEKSKGINQLQQILSPSPDDDGVWIHQDAWFHMGAFSKDKGTQYDIKKAGNGVYAFVLKGKFNIGGIELETRDGLGITDVSYFDLRAEADDSEILLMEIPMQLPKI